MFCALCELRFAPNKNIGREKKIRFFLRRYMALPKVTKSKFSKRTASRNRADWRYTIYIYLYVDHREQFHFGKNTLTPRWIIHTFTLLLLRFSCVDDGNKTFITFSIHMNFHCCTLTATVSNVVLLMPIWWCCYWCCFWANIPITKKWKQQKRRRRRSRRTNSVLLHSLLPLLLLLCFCFTSFLLTSQKLHLINEPRNVTE